MQAAVGFLSPDYLGSYECKQLAWRVGYKERMESLREKFRGQDCFLLCNGPSLNKVDFGALTGRHVIGMNKIQLLLERETIDLSLHVSINKLVIEQCLEDFESLDCPSFIPAMYLPENYSCGRNMIPIITKYRQQGSQGFTQDFLYEPIQHGHTVTYCALQLLYNLGFENIFIVGMDHNFETQGAANEEQRLEGEDKNHFDPRYFSGMQWQLPDIEGSEMNYSIANFVFNRNGKKIYDATDGGKCEIFDKLTFEEALKKCRKKN